jgi:hypothetical protein
VAQRQVSQILRPLGWLLPNSSRTQPAARKAVRAFLMVEMQQPMSSANLALLG